MTDNINQNPEQIARDRIDQMLVDSEWIIQSKNKVDLSAKWDSSQRISNRCWSGRLRFIC
jgi:hypothetical protein